jgi:hypothetical protein
MMADPARYSGVLSAMRSIVAEQGALGLFTGFGACLVRDVPYTMIQFAIFDALATQLSALLDVDRPTFGQALCIGAAAAVAASVVTLPIDVLKSQLQARRQPPAYDRTAMRARTTH